MTASGGNGVLLAMLRHGPTDWNAERRVQGRADRPLSEAGRRTVDAWRLPGAVPAEAALLSSPLIRAVETAEWVAGRTPDRDRRLIEMDWGLWEGRRIQDLRRDLGDEMARNEARGLDFRPEGGESPREVADRLIPLLKERAVLGEPAIAVSHKGVIRALLALSTGWGMTGKPRSSLTGRRRTYSLSTVKAVRPWSRRTCPRGRLRRRLAAWPGSSFMSRTSSDGHVRRAAALTRAMEQAGHAVTVASGGFRCGRSHSAPAGRSSFPLSGRRMATSRP